MRRALAVLAGAACIAATSAAHAAAPAGGIAVGPANATFPERAFVLTLPAKTVLRTGAVSVHENGVPVEQLTVAAADETAASTFGVVLALDASNSMRGAPLADALAAARSFAAERSPGTALGVITFGASIETLLEPSADAEAIHSALDRLPRLSQGTRMRDAVAEAVALLAHSRVSAGSVVVLSDGTDIGSRTGVAALVRLARAAGVRIYTVGLRSGQFDEAALRRLSAETGGRYAAARDGAALEQIYRTLGRDLAREMIVRYRSQAAPGTTVRVAVQVAGVATGATFAYTAPGAGDAVFHRSWQSRLVLSRAGIALVAGLTGLLAAFAALLAVRVLRPSVASRVAPYVHPRPSDRPREQRPGQRMTQLLDHSFERVPRWSGFVRDVEISRLRVPASTLAGFAAAGSFLLGPAAALLLGQPVLLLLAALPPLVVRSLVRTQLQRVRRRFEEELPDNIQVLASALRAGHGLTGALGVVVEDTLEPARQEFERALADTRLGTPLEDALSTVAERMQSSDLQQVALVAALHRETGGNTAEVLDRVHDALRERAELRRLVRSLTVEGRMTRWILTGLPVVLAVAITLISRSYISPLLDTGGGRALLVLAAAMVVAGSLVIRRIVEIEV